MSRPGSGAGGAGFTNMFLGSTVVVQRSRHAVPSPEPPPPMRLRTVTVTGARGVGKRTDSWKVLVILVASSVLDHSSKIEPKPREYRSAFDAASRTSKPYAPYLIGSTSRPA